MSARTFVVTLGATLAFLIPFVPLGGSDLSGNTGIDPPSYDEDCGDSVPPSGPYYDQATGRFMHYDCQTMVLTLGEVSPPCVAGEDADGNPTPSKGLCILIAHDELSDFFQARTLVAVKDTWDDGNYTVHAERVLDPLRDDRAVYECKKLPCTPHGTCRANGIVTFCFEPRYRMGCKYFDYVAGGHLEIRNPLGDWQRAHHSNTLEVCPSGSL